MADAGGAVRWQPGLLGRAATVELLLSTLATHRLVTLRGAPGAGKTALARAVAAHLAGRGQPVLWVELTECRSVSEVLVTIARSLAAQPPAGASPGALEAWLGGELRARGPGVVILDDAEGAAARLAAPLTRLHDLAPASGFLLTSRERTAARHEQVIELPLLELADAAELFAARLEATGAPRPPIDDDILALVEALDRLPLAIELAAARASLLSPRQLLGRLSRRLELLSGEETTTGRHRALRAAIDASWNALPGPTRSALAQASVFAGGFTVASAEAVIDLGPDGDVLGSLGALRARSLLTEAPGGAGPERRFALLASIRDYAHERLVEQGQEATVASRHAGHFLRLAERCAAAINAQGDALARGTLLAEQANVTRVVRDPATSAADFVRGQLALEAVRRTHGPFEELLAGLHAAVARAADVPPGLAARALLARGRTLGIQGRTADSIVDLEACVALAHPLDEPIVEGEALLDLIVRYRQQSRFLEAWQVGQRALELLEGAHQHPSLQGGIWALMGKFAAEDLGLPALARDLDERARVLFRERGDRWSEGLALGNLAQLDQAEGRWPSARWYLARTLEAFREVGDPRYTGAYLKALANLHHETGDLAAARAAYAEAHAALDSAHVRHIAGVSHACAGALEATLGDPDRARAHFDQAAERLAGSGASALADILALHRGHLELADAAGDRAALAAVRATLGARRAAVVARYATLIPALDGAVPLERRTGDLSLALRLLDAALRSPEPALRIGPEARWFCPPGGDEVSLLRRGAIRLILLALARARTVSPGQALPRDVLLEAGWPGERVQTEAGATRVRVAVATLRTLGLKRLLVTRDDGYLLAVDVPVVFPCPHGLTEESDRP